MKGVEINCGDLVFGDNEGILVFPRKFEKQIMSELMVRLSNEKNIISSVALGMKIEELTEYMVF